LDWHSHLPHRFGFCFSADLHPSGSHSVEYSHLVGSASITATRFRALRLVRLALVRDTNQLSTHSSSPLADTQIERATVLCIRLLVPASPHLVELSLTPAAQLLALCLSLLLANTLASPPRLVRLMSTLAIQIRAFVLLLASSSSSC
jgi:hypothetical protein